MNEHFLITAEDGIAAHELGDSTCALESGPASWLGTPDFREMAYALAPRHS